MYIGRRLFYAPEGDSDRRAMHLIQIWTVLKDPYLGEMLKKALSRCVYIPVLKVQQYLAVFINFNLFFYILYRPELDEDNKEIFHENHQLKDFRSKIPNFEQLFRPLNEYKYMENDRDHDHFFESIKEMLRVDPGKRPTASKYPLDES